MSLQGGARANPDPGCAWTGDLNGVWQLHPHLSAAYYFNGDGSGRSGCLRFFPPCQANELVPGLAVGHVAPQAGLLVLFPASVDHAVLENGDPDDSRFSLSLDLVLTAPKAHEGMAAAAGGPPEYLAPHPADWQPLTL